MANTTLEEGELEQSMCSVVEKSWYEQAEQVDQEMTNRFTSPGMVAESTTATVTAAPSTMPADDNSLLADTSNNSNNSSYSGSEHSTSSSDREILVSFLDVSNELKFERLLEKKKIKTTLKRCLSPTSASESSDTKRPSGTAADAEQADGTAASDAASANDDNENGETDNGIHEPRDTSPDGSSERSTSSAGKRTREVETDESILDRRQKQIDYGKNTIGYDEFLKQVPKEKRLAEHPWTPQKNFKYSRRAFDGLVKIWRKKLHCYDPSNINYAGSQNENARNGV